MSANRPNEEGARLSIDFLDAGRLTTNLLPAIQQFEDQLQSLREAGREAQQQLPRTVAADEGGSLSAAAADTAAAAVVEPHPLASTRLVARPTETISQASAARVHVNEAHCYDRCLCIFVHIQI